MSQLTKEYVEVFDYEVNILNLIEQKWQESGNRKPFHSAVNGTLLGNYSMIPSKICKNVVAASFYSKNK